MKPIFKIGLFIGLLFFGISELQAQAFRIRKFDSKIQLNSDGSLDITETINVNFAEPRRGILRVLPFRYTFQSGGEGEIAQGHTEGKDYVTPIVNVDVVERPFSISKAYSDVTIKIGDPNVTVKGDQQYILSYKVYGVLNQFKGNQELYLNITGNKWEAEIDTVTAEILLPSNKTIPLADIRTFSGFFGMQGKEDVLESKPGKISISRDQLLRALEGVTVAIRFPKNFVQVKPIPLAVIAENFVIDSIFTKMQLRADGAIEVNEFVWLNVLRPNFAFTRQLKSDYLAPVPYGWTAPKRSTEITNAEITALRTGKAQTAGLTMRIGASETKLEIPAAQFSERGKYAVHLKYVIWNSISKFEDDSGLFISWLDGAFSEPIAKARLQLNWEPEMAPNLSNLIFSTFAPGDGKLTLNPQQFELKINRPMTQAENAEFFLKFPNIDLPTQPAPLRLTSPRAYITEFHTELDFSEDGNLHISNDLDVVLANWYVDYHCPFIKEVNIWYDYDFKVPNPQKWGRSGEFLIRNMEIENGQTSNDYYDNYSDVIKFSKPADFREGQASHFRYSYDIFGILSDKEENSTLDQKHYNFALVEGFTEPIEQISFVIRYPGNAQLSRSDISFLLAQRYVSKLPVMADSLVFSPGKISGFFAPGKLKGEVLVIDLMLPEGISNSLSLEIQLLWLNHRSIFYPFLLLPILLLVWFIWGRDKRFPLVVEFYPPEDLTPTEAGLLFDDKLHNRDILALIYYWGAQGLIDIKEILGKDGEVTDCEFTKLKELPTSARKYERTMFYGLFKSGETTTKLSSKSGSFSYTMDQVRKEVTQHANTMKFYQPGTANFARIMRYLAYFMFGLAFLAMLLTTFGFSDYLYGRSEIALSYTVMGLLLLLFGRIMPKHAPFGQQQYAKLVGFEEFVLRADKEKLEELVNTNPAYFGMTLPYAIALGIATKWVSQFEGLATVHPQYYKSAGTTVRTDYDRFDYLLTRQLDMMSRNLNKRPVTSSSGGGSYRSSSSGSSYRSSSSSRSYSSSGSSGRSSFSSRGGSSGGGYGGGGGSSW